MSSLDSQNPLPNQTGAEMLERLQVFDGHIAIGGLTPDATEALQGARDRLHARFVRGAEYAAALAIATGITFPNPFETPDSTVTETPDAESKKIDAWMHLTPEQAAKAKEEIIRLAEEWNRDETDFGLIKSSVVDKDGNETAVFKVVLTSTEAIDLGDPEQSYDSRRNWNNTVKMVEEFGLSGLTIQDARVLAKTNPEIRGWLWRTGEAELADQGFAPITGVNDGQAGGSQGDSLDGDVVIGFRPAVVIA